MKYMFLIYSAENSGPKPGTPEFGEMMAGYGAFNKQPIGSDLMRKGLCREAIRLAEILNALQAGEAEIQGLLALMMLHDARQGARMGDLGELMTLELQDRALWNRPQIERGVTLLIGGMAQG